MLFSKLINKFPDVTLGFMKKTLREQIIEHNQEIHEINKRLDNIEETLSKIVKVIEEMQNG